MKWLFADNEDCDNKPYLQIEPGDMPDAILREMLLHYRNAMCDINIPDLSRTYFLCENKQQCGFLKKVQLDECIRGRSSGEDEIYYIVSKMKADAVPTKPHKGSFTVEATVKLDACAVIKLLREQHPELTAEELFALGS